MSFGEKVILIDRNFNTNSLPEKFENQLFISIVDKFAPYKYRSSLSVKCSFQGAEEYTVNGVKNILRNNGILIVNEGAEVIGECHSRQTIGASLFLEKSLVREVWEASQTKSNDIHEYVVQDSHADYEFYDKPFYDPTFSSRMRRAFGLVDMGSNLTIDFYYSLAEELMRLGANVKFVANKLNNAKKETRVEIFRRVNKAREMIDSGAYPHFDLDKLARECMMSKYFLIRSFKSVYNITPQKYYFQVRMAAARKLMANGLTPTRVAEQLGYPDIQSFSKQFKKHNGATPSSFRNHFVSLSKHLE